MSIAMLATESDQMQISHGQYLTFILDDELCGLRVSVIQEVLRLTGMAVSPGDLPGAPSTVNLRGTTIPLIDLRAKPDDSSSSERTCIIVVQLTDCCGTTILQGLVVDEVREIVRLRSEELDAAPDFDTRIDTEYVSGVAKFKAGRIALLDIERIAAAEELKAA
jgi:purine-binding chemotaxis protein CheW